MSKIKSKRTRGKPRTTTRVSRAGPRWWLALVVLVGIAAVAVHRWLPGLTSRESTPTTEPPIAAAPTAMPDAGPAGRSRSEALTIAKRLTGDVPDSAHALCLLATVHRSRSNLPEATRVLRRALELDPQCADAYQSLGAIRLKRGDYETAVQRLRQAQRIDPNWDAVPLPLAEALLHVRKFDEAAQVLESYVRRHAKSGDAWLKLGQIYQQAGDCENAKRANRAAIDADPNCVKAYYGLGMALQKLGDTEAANRWLEEFSKRKSLELKEIQAERARLRDGDIARKTLLDTCVTAGEIYVLHGRWNDAARCWRRAAALDANDIASREGLRDLLARQNQFVEAKQWAESVCQREPDVPGNWLRLGTICVEAGQPEQAEAPFRRVIELAPDKADGHAALAQVLMLPEKDNERAVAYARKAVELQPTADHYFVLAAACWTLEDWPQARAALERAIALNPTDPRYRKAYANLQSKVGK